MLFKDLSGQTFTRLLVIERKENTKHNKATWLCKCICGNTRVVIGTELVQGFVKSCGCLAKEEHLERNKKKTNIPNIKNTKHGFSKDSNNLPRIYRIWQGMKTRCYNAKSKDYIYYGYLGISVCDRWLEFKNFLEDMGVPEDTLTLDRINPYGNYEPSNCRWATRREQRLNQRRQRGFIPTA